MFHSWRLRIIIEGNLVHVDHSFLEKVLLNIHLRDFRMLPVTFCFFLKATTFIAVKMREKRASACVRACVSEWVTKRAWWVRATSHPIWTQVGREWEELYKPRPISAGKQSFTHPALHKREKVDSIGNDALYGRKKKEVVGRVAMCRRKTTGFHSDTPVRRHVTWSPDYDDASVWLLYRSEGRSPIVECRVHRNVTLEFIL